MYKFLLCATGIAIALPVTAIAQTVSDGTASAAASGATGLQDIIVTAQRRSESVQRAAASITALSGDALRAQVKDSIAAAIRDVPAVVVQGNANGAQIYVRGVGSNADSQLGDAAVNLNVDGVYQQETEVPTSLMFDVDRIEVLRGPQGTLYGRNATAGAINVVTTDPSLDAFGGYAMLQAGNYGGIHSEAAVNVPVGDTVAVRGAFASERHTGYTTNGNNDADIKAGRLKLLLKPSDSLRILIAGDYLHAGGHDVGTVEAPLSARENPYESTKGQGYLNIDYWNVRGQVDYDTRLATLSLLVAHNDFAKDEANILLLPGGVGDRREGRQNSVEFRISSPSGSPLKWVAGAYYLNDLEFRQVKTDEPASFTITAASDPELRDARTRSIAGFANLTVPLSSAIRLTGGLRYTDDMKSAKFYYADTDLGTVYASRHWTSFTYKAAAEADVGPASLAYAQVSSGFKAGGYAQQFPAATYNPEHLTAFEIGSKNRFADNHIQVNGAAFYYRYRNYQASYPDLVGGTFALVTQNAATATLYGLELETKFRLSPDDTLGASLAYLHSRFGTFTYVSVLGGAVDHTGQALPNAPSVTADLSYDHVFHLAGGPTVTAHVDTHISDRYWVSVERPLDSNQPAFTRTNAFVSYAPAKGGWSARLFVRNLENRAVRTLALSNPFDNVLMLAPPRTYGGAITVTF